MIYSCKDCTERYVGCHATCPTYNHDREKQDKLRAKIMREKEGWYAAVDHQQKSIRKALKKRRRGN